VSCRLVLSLALALALAPAPARADPAAYAAALRVFAPELDPARARLLAERVIAAADRAGLDARLVVAVVAVESGWDAQARSAAGARGFGQLMPATAAELHVDPADPDANLRGTVAYLRRMLDRYAGLPPAQRYVRALAAYNAGAAAVARFGGVPPFPETQRYVARVIALWRQLVAA
jgi:soluble lytic murein transglycosylase-like protein